MNLQTSSKIFFPPYWQAVSNAPASQKQTAHILLWNARGLNNKLTNFKNYIYRIQPPIICITETHLKANQNPKLRDYLTVREDRSGGFGGLAILHQKSVAVRPHKLIKYREGKVQAISTQYSYKGNWVTIILIYNPCKEITTEEFNHYFEQIEGEGVICGDFNAHHSNWESTVNRPNTTGKNLAEALNQNNSLSLLNPLDLPTRLDPNSGKSSNLDLFITTNLYLNKQLFIGEALGSDHAAVILVDQNLQKPQIYFRARWILKDENWQQWQQEI